MNLYKIIILRSAFFFCTPLSEVLTLLLPKLAFAEAATSNYLSRFFIFIVPTLPKAYIRGYINSVKIAYSFEIPSDFFPRISSEISLEVPPGMLLGVFKAFSFSNGFRCLFFWDSEKRYPDSTVDTTIGANPERTCGGIPCKTTGNVGEIPEESLSQIRSSGVFP